MLGSMLHMSLLVQCITEATLAAILAICVRAGVMASEATEPLLLTCAHRPPIPYAPAAHGST